MDLDFKAPPFDQFKGLHPLARDRRGHVSVETARHHLYAATDRRTNTGALIKITSRPGLTYQDSLRNEIASLLSINESLPESPYFPFVTDHGQLRDGRVYLITSFFVELPLATAIGEERDPGRTVAFVRTAMEIARAMGELHALKIYHADLNPMNVLLRMEHGTPIVRIIDFESSYEWERHSTGVFYNPPNTPEYSAPEAPTTHRTPVFGCSSAGAVLYTMLAGFEWTWKARCDLCVQRSRSRSGSRRILLRAVDPVPDNRYPSMEAFHADLAVHLETIWPGRNVIRPW